MGKLDGRSSRTAVCETCGVTFHPNYNAKGRFCSQACSRVPRLPIAEMTRLYVEEGLSSGEIAERLGLKPGSVYQSLSSRGVTLSRGEALARWHARASAEERTARAAAAHEASRGRRRDPEEIASTAIVRHLVGSNIGKHEHTFAAMLTGHGLGFDQQTPCDGYNIDFTLAEHRVAVEIATGGGSRGNWDRLRRRREHVLDHWHLFEVKFRKGRRVLEPRVVDELIAFCQEVGAHPAPTGQYRMVWPDGQRVRPRRRPSGDLVGAA